MSKYRDWIADYDINKKPLDEDPIVANVMQRMHDRSIEGMKKFGVSMLRQDTTTVEWIDNAIEELLDAAVYLERVKKDLSQ